MKLYPLKFQPIFHYRIWGGDGLKTILKKEYSEDSVGESWEISAVPDSETLVKNGAYQGKSLQELIDTHKGTFLGASVYQKYRGKFPLLLKFIDAKEPLSIQVHPNDKLAKERHGSLGKNEMWYIMPSHEDASITVGFKEQINKEAYQKHLVDNSLTDVLNEFPVKEGDVFYIPTGRVHAIGSGVMLAEIQQSSNVTYRIYDYHRKDPKTGETRELHTDLAMDAIDFQAYDQYKSNYSREINQINKLVNCSYFETNFLHIQGRFNRNFSLLDSFVIYMCVKGEGKLEYENQNYSIIQGECIFIPAAIAEVRLYSENMELIEIYI